MVVPFGMELVALDLHRLELILGDGDSDRVLGGVELAVVSEA